MSSSQYVTVRPGAEWCFQPSPDDIGFFTGGPGSVNLLRFDYSAARRIAHALITLADEHASRLTPDMRGLIWQGERCQWTCGRCVQRGAFWFDTAEEAIADREPHLAAHDAADQANDGTDTTRAERAEHAASSCKGTQYPVDSHEGYYPPGTGADGEPIPWPDATPPAWSTGSVTFNRELAAPRTPTSDSERLVHVEVEVEARFPDGLTLTVVASSPRVPYGQHGTFDYEAPGTHERSRVDRVTYADVRKIALSALNRAVDAAADR